MLYKYLYSKKYSVSAQNGRNFIHSVVFQNVSLPVGHLIDGTIQIKVHTSMVNLLILNYVRYRIWNVIKYFFFKFP